MPWECFVVYPTDRAYRTLRRYSKLECSNYPSKTNLNYHSRFNVIGETEMPGIWLGNDAPAYDENDMRWPAQCDCGYVFRPYDSRQHSLCRIFEGTLNGFLVRGTTGSFGAALPPGAMFALEPQTELCKALSHGKPGPDGRHWWIMLPGSRLFEVYAPCMSNGVYWTVQGAPPKIVVQPSINCQGTYHGWIGCNGAEPGFISDDVEGRKFHKNGVAKQ